MAADAASSDVASSSTTRGGHSSGNLGDGSNNNSNPHTCSPEELYLHVVGKWPGADLGYPADHSEHGPGASGSSVLNKPLTPTDEVDGDSRDASARAKKRRKVQRRAKVSEIWFPRAEMAFCTCVSCIPPNGRTKIKFFGRPLGRNELIAAICTLATRRMYNRKQISSHSQVLKDKVPHPYKEIFTFEDKARAGDDNGESSTANVIENYTFPDAIYNVIGYRVGSDLANAPKPAWLTDLEAGVSDSQAGPSLDSSATGRPYSYWNNGPDQYSGGGYYDRSGSSSYMVKGKERDGRMLPQPTSLESGYYPYGQQSARQPAAYGSSSSYQNHLMSPHSLPPPRDLDESPIAQHTTANDSSARYGYASYAPPMPRGGQRVSSGNQMWEGAGVDHSRSPTNSSTFDVHSQSSGISPRDQASFDVKPSISDGHITLPPLQEVPSATYSDWKWGPQQSSISSATRGGGGLPPLSNLPSLGSVASQTYSQPASGGGGVGWGSGGASTGYPQPWEDPRDRNRTPPAAMVPRPLASFVPSAVDFTAETREGYLSLTGGDPLVPGPPIPLSEIYMYKQRYPFLEAIAANPTVPVYHIDLPLMFGSDSTQRRSLLERSFAFDLFVSLRPLVDANGWALTTDAGFVSPRDTFPYPRVATTMRAAPSGDLTADARLPELARLYDQFDRTNGAVPDTFASVGVPMSILVQRVVRDMGDRTSRLPPGGQPGSDWSEASVVLIYTFWADARSGLICRPVDFERRPADVAADQLVSDLLAGEEQQPSKFDWL